MRIKKTELGFTLMEEIVATFLFVLVVSAVVGLYMSSLKLNRKTDTIRTAAEDSRFLSEFLSKEIRNSTLDYNGPYTSPCGSPSASSNSLEITNVDGDAECFYLGDAAGNISGSGPYLWLIKNNYAKQPLDIPGISVNSFVFNINPACDPYNNKSCSQVQPVVTMIGSIEYSNGQNSIIMPFETSISMLQYGP